MMPYSQKRNIWNYFNQWTFIYMGCNNFLIISLKYLKFMV